MEISSEQFVLSTLADDAYVMVNKKFLRAFKGDGSAAVFLGELISMHKYNITQQSLEPDNSFRCLTKRIKYAVGLSEYKQHRILDKFESVGLIKLQLKGFPATKFVTINFDMLIKILDDDEEKSKKINTQNFYNDLNLGLNAFQGWTDPKSQERIVENVEHCCDNMGEALRGAVILISKHYTTSGMFVNWTAKDVGRVTQWVRNRGFGRPFDFTLITRTLARMRPITADTKFESFISDFIMQAKATQDIHFSSQQYDYHEILKE